MVKMFKYFFLFFALVSYGWSAQAQMKVRSYNLNSFPKAKTYSTATVAPLSSVAAQQHPEFGQVPFATQCSQCAEHIDKRTANTRFFTDEKNTQTTYAQQSYFPLHYQPKGSKLWHTIDPRLQNKGLGRYAAPHQPVATLRLMDSFHFGFLKKGKCKQPLKLATTTPTQWAKKACASTTSGRASPWSRCLVLAK
jgi:hypothetical protein